ncbi:MAG: zinc-dependent peptidase [bacterium]|nr:zinc-dependent peptidase [bacterium]
MRTSRLTCLICILLASIATACDAKYKINPPTKKQVAEYKLDTKFYKKCTTVQNILIATSGNVSDYAHREAAYLFDTIMKSIDQKVAQRVRDKNVLCLIVGRKELTSDLPQYASKKTGKELDFYNWRNRGFLSWKNGRPTVVFSEEDVIESEEGMQTESILIHEFAHVIHQAGFDKKLQKRLTETFKQIKKKGLWNDGRAAYRFCRIKSKTPVSLLEELIKYFPDESPELLKKCLDGGDILVNGKPTNSKVKITKKDKIRIVFGGPKQCYAAKNRAEYFAEILQCWYNTNRTMDHDHNHIHTRKQLKAYDPLGAKLCEDVLGDSKWRFVSPRNRIGVGHLKGYDPSKLQKIPTPEHIKQAGRDFFDKYWKDYWQRLRDKYAAPHSAKDYSVTKVKGWSIHIHKKYVNGDQAAVKNALKNVEIQLGHVETLMPAKAVAKLRKIPIWISPGKRKAEYHWSKEWVVANGRPAEMARCVQITNINKLRRTSPTGPWVLLHELAHGYHDREVSKEDFAAISKAYKNALAKGLYQKVLHTNRGPGKYIKAYAATRMHEYFAECCEAYFGVNDFYPFVRVELQDYDPEIYKIIERVFQVRKKR